MKNKFLIQERKFRLHCILQLALFVLILVVTTQPLNAQTAELKKNIKLSNVTVQDLVDKLGIDFKYSFFIVDEQVGKTTVSVNIKNATVTQILDLAFKNKEISYVVNVKSITITSKKEAQVSNSPAKKITGLVTDEKGEPVIGASVILKGGNAGTITNVDGQFTLEATQQSQIIISYIGYKQTGLTVSTANSYKITLEEDSKGLDEVVVIGYGTQKKREVTGSVAIVKSEDLNFSSTSNFGQALQGKAAGVQVTQATGQPGAGVSIQLRSNPSNANAGVLYVVDGVPVNDNAGTPSSAKYGTSGVDQSPLNFINPEDIETNWLSA